MTPAEVPTGPSLRQRAVSGVILVMAQGVIGRASLFVGQLVLARILHPADFGAVALAATISSISAALVGFGIDQILQQRRHNARLWATQVFALSLGFALAGAGLMVLIGFAGAAVFDDPALPLMMLITGAATVLSALWTVPQAALQWQLRFKLLAAYVAFDAVLTQALIIAAASLGFGAFSFFLPLLLTNSLRAIVYWRAAQVKLRPLSRSRGWRLIVRRGMTALGSRISQVIIGQGDFLILALFAPKPVVGAYYFAFRLASQPMTLVSGSVTAVLFSSLLKVTDRSRRAAIAFQACELIGAVTLPLCLMVAAAAGPGMVLLFGERWRAATPLVQILSIGLPFDAIAWPASALLLADGAFRRAFLYQTWSLPLFLAAATLGAAKGLALGVATGVAIYYLVHSLAYAGATFWNSEIGFARVAALFGKLFACALASFGPAYLLISSPVLQPGVVGQLALALVAAPALYAAALFLLARPAFDAVFRQALGVLDRFAPKLAAPFRLRMAR